MTPDQPPLRSTANSPVASPKSSQAYPIRQPGTGRRRSRVGQLATLFVTSPSGFRRSFRKVPASLCLPVPTSMTIR